MKYILTCTFDGYVTDATSGVTGLAKNQKCQYEITADSFEDAVTQAKLRIRDTLHKHAIDVSVPASDGVGCLKAELAEVTTRWGASYAPRVKENQDAGVLREYLVNAKS